MTEVEAENDITEDMNNSGVTYSNTFQPSIPNTHIACTSATDKQTYPPGSNTEHENTNEVYNLFSSITDFDELTIVNEIDKLNKTSDGHTIIFLLVLTNENM